MGNVEGKLAGRRHVEAPYCTSRPLPPLPREEEVEEIDDDDLDSPPPYPPPPPPGEEHKRFSWRFRDSAVFGHNENKRRSWLLNFTNGGDKTKGKLAKDGKDVNDIQVNTGAGGREGSSIPGVKIDTQIEPNTKMSSETTRLHSYKITTNETTGNSNGSSTSPAWQTRDGKLISVNKSVVKGEDGEAPGYSLLHECTRPEERTDISPIQISANTNMSQDLKDVIEELRGNPNVETKTIVKTVSDGQGGVVTVTTTQKTLSSHVTVNGTEVSSRSHNDSLSKLEAELSALLSPGLDGHSRSNLQMMNGAERGAQTSISAGDGVGPQNNGGVKVGMCRDDTYKVSVSPNLPLPDLQEFSGKGAPLLPDVVKDDGVCGSVDPGSVVVEGGLSGTLPKMEMTGSLPSGKGDVDSSFHVDVPKLSGEVDEGVLVAKDGTQLRFKSSDLDVSDPEFVIDTDGVSVPSGGVQVSGKKPSTPKKNKPNSGPCSCLSPPSKLEAEEPYASADVGSDMNVKPPSAKVAVEADVGESKENVDASLTADVKGPEMKKKPPKAKLGSCFGKPKQAKSDAKVDFGEGAEIEVKSPSIEEASAKAEVSGSLPSADIKLDKPSKKKNTKLPSCFGKPKEPKSTDSEGADYCVKANVPSVKTNAKVKVPSAETEMQVPEGEVEFVGAGNTELSLTSAESSIPKIKATVERKADTPNLNLKTTAAPTLEMKSDFEVQGDIPSFNEEGRVPEFGLQTKVGEIEIAGSVPAVNIDISAPDMSQIRAEGQLPKSDFEIQNLNQKAAAAKMDVDVPLEYKLKGNIPDVKNEGIHGFKGPDLGVDVDVPGIGSEATVPAPALKADVSVEAPDLKMKAEKPKEKAKLGSCFGKPKTTNIEEEYKPGKAGIEGPEVKLSGNIKTPEVKADIDTDSPEVKVGGGLSSPAVVVEPTEVKVRGGKGKGKFGSCFGKPKTPEVEGEYKPEKTEVENPVVSAGMSVEVPEVEGDVSIETPEVKAKGKKPTAKLGSCFGKQKSPKIESECQPGKADTDVLEVSGEASIKTPEGEAQLNVQGPDVKGKGGKGMKKPNMKLGSCFGKPKEPKVAAGYQPSDLSVEGPKVMVPKAEVEIPDTEGEIGLEVPKASVDVKIPGLPSQAEPAFKIEGDIPKVEAKLEGKAELPDIELEGKFPSAHGVKANIDIGETLPDVKLEGNLPKSDIELDIDGNLPSFSGDIKEPDASLPDISIPKVEGEIKGNLPTAELSETKVSLPSVPSAELKAEVEAPKVSGKVDVPKPKLKHKKAKIGPCACLGGPKKGKLEEPYASAGAEIKTPLAEKEIELAAEGKADPSIKVEGDIKTPSLAVEVPKGKAEIDVDAPKLKVKGDTPKNKFGSCFGKPRSPQVEGEYKPGKVEVDVPEASVEACVTVPETKAEISVEAPDVKAKTEKPKAKAKFGSCFGKPKTPKVEGEHKPGKVEVEVPTVEISGDINAPETKTDIDIESPELQVAAGVSSPALAVESPEVKVKGGKGKGKFGSCFGKPKTPEVEGEYKSGKAEVEVPKVSAGVSVETPEVKGDVSVEAPEVKAKAKKPKAKLGSCFGKPKSPRIEGDHEPGKVDVDVPEVSGEACIKTSKGDTNLDVEAPDVKVKGGKGMKKPKMKLGSCFGKSKAPKVEAGYQPPEVRIETPEMKVPNPEVEIPDINKEIEMETPKASVDVKMPILPEVKGDISVGIDVPKTDPALKIKADMPDIPKVEAKLEGKTEFPDNDIEVKLPSMPEVKADIDTGKLVTDVNFEGEPLKADMNVNIGGNLPSFSGDIKGTEFSSPEISMPKVEGEIKGDLSTADFPETKVCLPSAPSAEIKAELETPKITGKVDAPDPKLKGKKAKFGPCACLGGPKKGNLEEPYNSKGLDTKTPEGGKGIEVAAEGKLDPSLKVEGEISGPIVAVEVPEGKADIHVDSPTGKVNVDKPKSKFGSCFGKPKSPQAGGEYKPGKVEVDVPEASVEACVTVPETKAEISVEAPDVKAKTEKPKAKAKFGSCFGKPKTPKVEGEHKPGKVEVGVPVVEISGDINAPETKTDIDIESPELQVAAGVSSPALAVESPEVKVKGGKGKGKFGSCFGKPKTPEVEGEYKSGKAEVEVPEVSAGVSVETPEVKGDVSVEAPEVKAKAKKPKAKLGSCFGKPKSPRIEGDHEPGKVDVDVPEVSGEACVKTSKGDTNLDVEAPDVKVKGGKGMKKPKMKLGSCFGKSKAPKVEAGYQPPEVRVETPEMKVPNPEVEIPDINKEIEMEAPKASVDVKMPILPEVKGDISVGIDVPKTDPALKIKADMPDIPKVEAKLEGKAELPDNDIEVKLPSMPEVKADIDTGKLMTDVNLEGELPKADMNVNISGNLPSFSGDIKGTEFSSPEISMPKVEGEIKGDLSTADFPEAKVCLPSAPSAEIKMSVETPKISGKVDVQEPDLKGKKPKFGPCACLGGPNKGKLEEPYISAESEVEAPVGGRGIGFGAEGKIDPSLKVEGDISGPSVAINVPEGQAKIDVDAPKVKVKADKPKSKFGSCFGKPRSPEVGGEYKPGKVDIEAPEASAEASVALPETRTDINVEVPDMKVKPEKPKAKAKFGSCFGKPKTPKVEGKQKPGKVEVEVPAVEISGDINSPEVKTDIDIESPDVQIAAGVSPSALAVESPEVKVKGGKGKGKFGSCFGKPKTPEVEGEYKSGKAEVEVPEVSAGVSVETPEVKGDVSVEAPEVKAKAKKPKTKLGSCFGKPKSSKIESDYQPGKIDVDVPEVSGEASIKMPKGEADLDVETPDVKVKEEKGMKKPKMKLGSCFRKPKSAKLETGYQPPEVTVKGPEINIPEAEVEISDIEGQIGVETRNTSVDFEMPGLPDVKGDISMGIDVLKAEPILKIEGDIPDLPKVEANMGGRAELPDIEIEGTLPSVAEVKTNTNIGGTLPDVKVEGELPKGDVELDIGGNLPSFSRDIKEPDISLSEISIPKVEGQIKGDLPTGELPKTDVLLPSAEIKAEVEAPEISGKADIPQPKFEGKRSKFGPCACLGGPKKGKLEEPYVSTGADIKAPVGEKGIKVGAEEKISPRLKIEGDIPGPSVTVEAPEGKAEIIVDTPNVKIKDDKQKSKFGSCFGKSKSPKVEGEYQPRKVDVDVPGTSAEASLTIPEAMVEASVEAPDVKVNAEKPKTKAKFGSCFGKPKTTRVEGDYKSGKVDIKSPALKISGDVQAPEAKTDVDIESPGVNVEAGVSTPAVAVESSEVKIKGDKGKGKLGYCFGKPKTPEIEDEYKPGKAEVVGPEGSAGVSVQAPEVKEDITVEAPEVKAKGKKPKAKFGSCFGKPKSPKVETEYQTGKVDVDIPEVSGEASVNIPERKTELDVNVPDVKDKEARSMKKKKINFGSCFGKPKGGNVEAGFLRPQVTAEDPEISVPKAKVEITETKGEIGFEAPEASVGVKMSGLPDMKDNMSMGIDIPKAVTTLKIEGDIPDVPKVESELGGKAELPDIKVEGQLPSVPELKTNIDIDGALPDLQLEGELPKADVNVDIDGSLPTFSGDNKGQDISLPDISTPKIKGEFKGDMPTAELPKVEMPLPSAPSAEIDPPHMSGNIDVPEPKLKGKKAKFGPCACLAGPKKAQLEEPYASAGAEIKVPEEGKVIKVGAEGKMDPSLKVGDISAPSVLIEAPEGKAEINVDTPNIEVKGDKPKTKFGSCFKKPKSLKGEEEYKPGKVDVDVPEASVETSVPVPEAKMDVSVEAPGVKVKAEKPKGKAKFGSCFGKPKTPKVESDYKSTKVDVEDPELKFSGNVKAPEAKSDFDIESPGVNIEAGVSTPAVTVESPEMKVKGDKGKGKFGSCFGKPKTPEIESEYKPGEAELEGPEGSARVSVQAPKVKGDITVEAPEVKAKGNKPKAKFGSCFGKPKSPKVETEYQTGKVDVDVPEVSSKASIETPKLEAELDIEASNMKVVKGEKDMKKPKISLGSCFGKPKGAHIEAGYKSPEVTIKEPELKIPEAEVEIQDIEGEIGVDVPKTIVDVKMPESPKVEGDISMGITVPKTEPVLKIEGDIPDLPKVDAKMGGKTELPKIDVEGNLPSTSEIKTNIDVDGTLPDMKLEGTLPDVKLDGELPKSDVKVDVGGNLPSFSGDIKGPDISSPEISIPKVEGEIKGDLPTAEFLETKVSLPTVPSAEVKLGHEAPKISGEVDVAEPKLKGTKAKFGPCACLGGPKKNKLEEPYVSAGADIKTPAGGKGINIGAEGTVDPSLKVEGDISGPNVAVEVPEGKAEIDVDTQVKVKERKPKTKFGACFGKPRSPEVGGEYIPRKIDVDAPGANAEANVDAPEIKAEVNVEPSDVNVKAEKPMAKAKFGSCFGNPKTPKVEGEYKPGKVEVEDPKLSGDIKFPEAKGDIDIESPEVKIEGGLSPSVTVDSTEMKVGDKGKGKFGSCFGKPKTPEIDGEYTPEKPEVEAPKLSAAVSVKTPEVERDINVETPEIKDKGKKPKANFGSCFRKPKSSEVEAEYQPGMVDVDIPEVSGKANLKTPEAEGKLDIDAPDIKVKKEKGMEKSNMKLGSCFGKPKGAKLEACYQPPEAKVEGPEIKVPKAETEIPVIAGKMEIEVPKHSVDIEIPNLPEMEGDISMGIDVPKAEARLEGKTEVPNIDVEGKTNIDIDGTLPDVKFEGEGKFPLSSDIAIGRTLPNVKLEGELPKSDMEMDFGGNLPSFSGDIKGPDISLSDISTPKVEGVSLPEISIPNVEVKGQLPTSEFPDVEVALPSAPSSTIEADLRPKDGTLGEIVGNISTECSGVTVGTGKVKIPSIEQTSCDVLVPEGKIQLDIDTPKPGFDVAGPNVDIKVPEDKVEVDYNAAEVKVKGNKPKMKFGACFGKPKNPDVEEKYKLGKVDVDVPEAGALANVEPPNAKAEVSVEDPDMKGKPEKPKGKIELGSCFGKPKTPKVEGEYKPAKVKVEDPEIKISGGIRAPEAKADIDIASPDITVAAGVSAPAVPVESPQVKVEGGKGKGKLGSCFGKPKTPEVQDEYKPGKTEIKCPEGSAGVSVEASGVKGDVSVEAPEIKAKGRKPKAKLGSCFGEPKPAKVEGEYQPGKVEIDIPEVSGEVCGETVEGEIDLDMKVKGGKGMKKPNMKFGSYFGKQKGTKVDADYQPPEVSVQTPEIKIPKSEIGFPDMERKIEMDVPKSSIDVEMAGLPEVNDDINIEISVPKYEPDLNIEGDMPDLPKVEAKLGGKAGCPDIEVKGKLPSVSDAKTNIDIDGTLPDVKLGGELPKGDVKVNFDGSLPSVSGDIKGPDISSPEILVPKVGKIEGEIPCLKLEGDFPSADIEVNSSEASSPSAELTIKSPKIETKNDTEFPNINADLDPTIPDIKAKNEKHKFNIGSWLGKAKSPLAKGQYSPTKAQKIDAEISGTANIRPFDAQIDLDIPVCENEAGMSSPEIIVESPEVNVKGVKGKTKLGSCFGKPKNPNVENEYKPGNAKVDDSEVSAGLHVATTEVKGNINVDVPEVQAKSKKPKAKFGSCFGKPKSLEGENEYHPGMVEADVPELTGGMAITGPSIEVGGLSKLPEIEVQPEPPIPPIRKNKLKHNVNLPEARFIGNIPECNLEANLQATIPDVLVGTNGKNFEFESDIPQPQPGIGAFGGKLDLKADAPDIKADAPEFAGKLDFKTDVPEIKADVPRFGGKLDFEAEPSEIKTDVPGFGGKLEFKTDVPEVKADVSGFEGKLDIEAEPSEIKTDVPGFGGKLEFKTDIPEIKTDDQRFGGVLDFKANGPEIIADVPEIKDDVPGFIGKMHFKADVPEVKGNLSEFGGALNVKADVPELKTDVPGFGGKLDFKTDVPEIKADVPRFGGKLDFEAEPSEIKTDVPGFGGKLEFKTDVPEVKADVSGFEGKLDLETDVPDVPRFGEKLGLKTDVPEVNVDVPGFGEKLDLKTDVPEVKTDIPGFGGKLDLKTDVPDVKTDIPGFGGKLNLKTDVPDINVDVPGFERKLDLQTDMPEVNVDVPGFEGKLDLKTDMPEVNVDIPGFGGKLDLKTDVPEVNVDVPGFGGKLDLKTDVPEVNVDVPGFGRKLDLKTDVPGFGGKLDLKTDVPEVNVDVPGFGRKLDLKTDVPGFGGKLDLKTDVPEVNVDVPGFGGKLDLKTDVPEVNVDVPGFGGKLDLKTDVPGFGGKLDLKTDVPEVNVDVPGFGGKLDFKSAVPELKTDEPGLEGKMDLKADVSGLEGKLDFKTDAPEVKADFSGFGRNLDFKTDVPEVNTDVPGFEGNLDIETDVPDVKANVTGFGGKLDFKADVPEIMTYVPGVTGNVDYKSDVPVIKAEADIPEVKSCVPGFGGKVDFNAPQIKADIPEIKADIPEIKADIPEFGGKSNVLGFEGKLDLKADVPEGRGDVPEFGEKHDSKADVREVKVAVPSFGGKFDMKTDVPEVRTGIPGLGGEIDLKPNVPETKADVTGFRGKMDLKAGVSEFKADIPEIKDDIPEIKTDIPEVRTNIPSFNNKADDPDFAGKVDIKADVPGFGGKVDVKGYASDVTTDIPVFDRVLDSKVDVPEVEGDVPALSGKLDLMTDIPDVKGDVPGLGGKVDLRPDVKKIKTDVQSFGENLNGDVPEKDEISSKPVSHFSAITSAPLNVNISGDVHPPVDNIDPHNDAPVELRSPESSSIKTRIPILDMKSKVSDPSVPLASVEANLPAVKVGFSVSQPQEGITEAPTKRGSRKKRGRRGRSTEEDVDMSSVKPWDKPGDKVYDFEERPDIATRGLETQLRFDTDVPGGNDDSSTRSRIPRFSGISKLEVGTEEDMRQPLDIADVSEGQVRMEDSSGIPVLSERISISFSPQDEIQAKSNIPVATASAGAAPIGWVLSQSTTQSPTHGVTFREGQSLPGEGITIQPGQFGVKGEVSQHEPESKINYYEGTQVSDPYIRGKLGPFKLTPERTVSECKTEITKITGDPDSQDSKFWEMQGPETVKQWTLEPQSYQVTMETDPNGRLQSDPNATDLKTKMVIGGDSEQKAGKQSRTVFVTEDAGGRVVVHRRMDSTPAPPGEQTTSVPATPVSDDLSSMLLQSPASTVVTTSEWPEGVTTQRTVRVRKIRKIKVGDGPEETILETDYETLPGEEPDLSRLEGVLESSEVLRVTPEGEPNLSHLPPELRDNSLLHFGSDQREAPGDTHQTVTRTVKRIPSGEIAQYLPEGFDKNLHRVVGGTTTTTTKTMRKVKVLKKDESGNMVECDADDEDLQALLPYISSESASTPSATTTTTSSTEDDGGRVTTTTTTTTDGGTVTRVIREKRFITDGSSISEFEEGLAAAGECEGGVPERVGAEPDQPPDNHKT